MDFLHAINLALSEMASPAVLAAVLGGTAIGLISGALPGVALPGLVVLLSVASTMPVPVALGLAMGMAAPVHSSDSLPAVMLGVPGTVAAQATIMDGYPLARKGKAGLALSAGYFASLIGALAGIVILVAIMPVARVVVNVFAAPEFLVMGLMGVAVVAVVSSGAMLKGLLAGAVGLGIAAIGIDPNLGYPRFVPASLPYLYNGLDLVTVIIGIFALPEVMGLFIENRSVARGVTQDAMWRNINEGRREGIQAVLQNKFLVFRSVALGVIGGIMPGLGQSVLDWLVYAFARSTEKGANRTFGTGDIRGVIAPESANNATNAAQLIPTLALGIPVHAYQALYLSLFIIVGLQPGPRLLNDHLDVVMFIAFSLALSSVVTTAVLLFMSRFIARIALVRAAILAPLVFVFLVLAAYTSKNNLFDLVLLAAAGLVGWHMKRFGWPRPPLIIGFVVGPILERYLNIALNTYTLGEMLARPGVVLIVASALVIAVYASRLTRSSAAHAPAAEEPATPTPVVAAS
jgi:putative tricarboxylic transport membrane protein